MHTAQGVGGAGPRDQGSGLINVYKAMWAAPDARRRATRPRSAAARWTPPAARTSSTLDGVPLTGEQDIFGVAFDSAAIAAGEEGLTAWSRAPGTVRSGRARRWAGSSWAGSSWAGSSWAGSSWAGSSWAGSSWAGSSWAGSSWAGGNWSDPSPSVTPTPDPTPAADPTAGPATPAPSTDPAVPVAASTPTPDPSPHGSGSRRLPIRLLRSIRPQRTPRRRAVDRDPDRCTNRMKLLRRPATPAAGHPSRAWTAGFLIAAAGFGLAGFLPQHSASPAGPTVSWLLLAALFGIAEVCVLHVQMRGGARTVSLSEAPLVLGLFFTAPPDLVLARLIGPLVVFAIIRRQSLVKLGRQHGGAAGRGRLGRRALPADLRRLSRCPRPGPGSPPTSPFWSAASSRRSW